MPVQIPVPPGWKAAEVTASVCVVITARNASATIAQAVRSALDQPEVAEVVVVDDASTDATGTAAREAAKGDARLTVLRNDTNLGPSAGRNRAIAASRSPYIAILDADDYLLPGRFQALFAISDWEMIADNIAFVPERLASQPLSGVPTADTHIRKLDLATFAIGNLQRSGRGDRGELGFLKPVLSRDFLTRHGLRFNEDLWLGEDFDLYVRMLAAGARFLVSHRCGYVALVREGSLSGRHRTGDLAALMAACEENLRNPDMDAAARTALQQHLAEIRVRWLLRRFLDEKAQNGLSAALAFALNPPGNFPPIFSGVLRDKLRAYRPQPSLPPEIRLLLSAKG